MTQVRFSAVLALVLAAPSVLHAQTNAPLTGSMAMQAGTPASQLESRPVVRQVATPLSIAAPVVVSASDPAVAAAGPATAAPERVGDVTRGVMAAQADGRRAGGALPVLGPVASAAWTRYLNSFSHPIPERFAERVQVNTGGAGNTGG